MISYKKIDEVSGVYKITNVITGKFYIGSSNNCRKRAYSHLSELQRNSHRNTHLQNAWNKYGETAFIFEIIACVPNIEDLTRIEQEFINEYKPHIIGYNICHLASNFSGIEMSPETREKLSKKMSGNGNPFYGKTHSEDTRGTISEKMKERFLTEKPTFLG